MDHRKFYASILYTKNAMNKIIEKNVCRNADVTEERMIS